MNICKFCGARNGYCLQISIVKLDLGGDVAAFRIEVDMGIRNVPLKCLDSTGLKVGQEVVVMRSLAENTPWPKGTYVGRCQLGEGDLWFDGFSQRGMSWESYMLS